MVETGRLGFCIDEACGRPLADILCRVRAPGAPRIHESRDLGLIGVSDEILMAELGQRGFAAFVTRDSRILNASLRRAAWRQSGLTIFVLERRWGNLNLFEQARRLIWCWPDLAEALSAGPAGAAWQVHHDVRTPKLVRLFLETPE